MLPSVTRKQQLVLNVQDYGVIGDDAATDQSTKLQNAINAASTLAAARGAGYVEVFIPGNMKIQAGGVIPKSGVCLRSEGGAIVTNNDSQGIITNRTDKAAVSRFWVFGVEFVGAGQTYAPGGSSDRHGAINVYNGTDIKIHNCVASGFSFHGFSLVNGQDISVRDNILYDVCDWAQGNAINISLLLTNATNAGQAVSRVSITGNVVRNCRTAPICVASYAHDSEVTGGAKKHYTVVADNPYLEAVADSGAANRGFSAIAIEVARYVATPDSTSQGNKIHRVHVHHNHCVVSGAAASPAAWGITVTDNNGSFGGVSTDADEFADITLDHNTIESVDGGISCQASDVMIDHNIVRAVTKGIRVSYNGQAGHIPTRQHVDNNSVIMTDDGTGKGWAGIDINTTSHTRVTHNRVTYGGSSTEGSNGGIILTSASYPDVIGNRVRLAPIHGIYLDTCDNANVCGNRVIDCSVKAVDAGHGIAFSSCTAAQRTLVQGNDILDSRGGSNRINNGINSSGGTPRLVIDGNSLWGIHGTLMSFSGSNPTIIHNNSSAMSSFPSNPASISPGASPYTYTNSDYYDQEVWVVGGTVSAITKTRNSTSISTGLTSGPFRVEVGESITVTYTVAPTMTKTPLNTR